MSYFMNNNLNLWHNKFVKRKGVIFMSVNSSIKCSVKNCQYNDEAKSYCTLNEIQIGTHETNPTVPECTDCESFKLK